MIVELMIDGSKYPVEITYVFNKDSQLICESLYKGSTISTFNSYETYKGKTLEESLNNISLGLKKAIEELLNY